MLIGRENLARVDAIILALMCKKMWQDEKQPAQIREQAKKFLDEWIVLQDSEPGEKGNGEQFGHIEEQVADIKERMLDFLAPIAIF